MNEQDSHLTPAIIEEYVTGVSQGSTAAWVESHAASCLACGALLEREARLECALSAAARGLRQSRRRVESRPVHRRRIALFVSGGAALAASLLVFVVTRAELPGDRTSQSAGAVAWTTRPMPPVEAPISPPPEELSLVVFTPPLQGDLP